jgi:glycosyltransferase involved in cell wall biosynthesis
MKIAIITSGFLPVIDGVTVSGFHRLQRLSRWGHEVMLFCPDYQSLADVYPNWQDYIGDILPGVKVFPLDSTPFMDLDFERNVSRKSYRTLWRELEKFQPEIIHVDEPERLFLGFWRSAGVDFAKKNNIPCVGFFRTNFVEYIEDFFPVKGAILNFVEMLIKRFIAWVYNAYDLTLIHSVITKEKLIKMGIKNVLYQELWGFEPEVFANPNLKVANFFRDQYQLEAVDDQVKLLFIGRLTPDKGWNFALDAFPKVAKMVDLDRVAIIVAGDGPQRTEIAEKLGKLTKNVHLLGRVAPENIPALLANSDIYISNSEKENRALTVVEALASGTPVLVPNAGGVVENMTDGKTGFIYIPQDKDNFALKLKQLIEHPDLWQEMGKNGYQNVAGLTLDKAVKNLLEIWTQEIIKKSKIHLS